MALGVHCGQRKVKTNSYGYYFLSDKSSIIQTLISSIVTWCSRRIQVCAKEVQINSILVFGSKLKHSCAKVQLDLKGINGDHDVVSLQVAYKVKLSTEVHSNSNVFRLFLIQACCVNVMFIQKVKKVHSYMKSKLQDK